MISFDSHYHPFKYFHYPHFTNEVTDAQRKEWTWRRSCTRSAEMPISLSKWGKPVPAQAPPQHLCTSARFGNMSLFSPCYLQPDWRNPLKHLTISSSPADPSPGFILWKYDPAKSSAWQNIRLMTSKCSESQVSWVLVRLNKPREALLEVIKW